VVYGDQYIACRIQTLAPEKITINKSPARAIELKRRGKICAIRGHINRLLPSY